MDIIKCIQSEVNNIAKEKYSKDDTPPIFTVSLLYEGESGVKQDKDHKLVLTVCHIGLSFSKVIFPQTENVFGYECLEEEMKYLYNRTM